MTNNKKPPQKKLYLRIWLAIIGGVIIITSAQMSRYRFFSETEIYNYLIPAGLGVLFFLPLLIYITKSK